MPLVTPKHFLRGRVRPKLYLALLVLVEAYLQLLGLWALLDADMEDALDPALVLRHALKSSHQLHEHSHNEVANLQEGT